MRLNFFDFDLPNLKNFLIRHQAVESGAPKIFQMIYKDQNFEEGAEKKVGARVKSLIINNFSFDLPKVEQVLSSQDATVKFVMSLYDGQKIETVLIPFLKRYTLCLSTQVGCAMKCSFCYTGTQGLKRNLLAREIVGQYLVAWNWLKENIPEKSGKPHIVYMGQGEPLHNFEEVKKATEIFIANEGINLSARQITLSTVGYLPGLQRFQELPPINLAFSLHAPFDTVRSQIIPINRQYSLSKILEVIGSIPFRKKQIINCEYTLIPGINDRYEDAMEIIRILEGKRVIVNIIPFNEFPGAPAHFRRPTLIEIAQFRKFLRDKNFFVTVRTTKGDDILAACGQLSGRMK